MPTMGPMNRAIFGVSLFLMPSLVSAQAPAPAQAAFPAPTPEPAPASPAPTVPVPAPAATPAPATTPPGPYPGYYPPPPPGYPPYGYYYPPPPPPPPRFADDAAVSSTPFVDAVIAGVDWKRRLSGALNVGVQAGLFVAGRVRLSAKLVFPSDNLHDDDAGYGFGAKDPSLFYAFSAGVAAVRTPSFVMSPGLMFARTDVSDYGTMLGLSLPLEWVTGSGLRLGIEGGLGRAFGGRTASNCNDVVALCTLPPYRDREGGSALWFQFHVGFGFNHPAPLPANVASSR